jgi:hypothetical protein
MDSTSRYDESPYLSAHPGWHVEDSPWKVCQFVPLLREAGITSLDSICEVGCGAGEVLWGMGRELGAARLVGYEVADAPLEIARRAHPEIRFERRDIEHDRPDTRFDLALLVDVLEHVENPHAVLRATATFAERVLIHLPLELNVQAAARAGRHLTSRAESGHIHYFSRETALALVAECGLTPAVWAYTPSHLLQPKSRRAALMQLPRKAAFRLSPDLTSRVLGGPSLAVLAVR